jgi:hypothetical protein
MRKRLLLTLIGLTCLALLGRVLFVQFLRVRGINRAGYDALRKDMTRKEVEHLLGAPPGEYYCRTFPNLSLRGATEDWGDDSRGEGSYVKVWAGDEGVIAVRFDREDRVLGACFTEPERRGDTFMDRLHGWLGL